MGTKQSKTKELICQTSIALFNEQGFSKVSTNHIARAIPMSSGNLYYHYKNKMAITEDIYKKLEKSAFMMLDLAKKIEDKRLLIDSYFMALSSLLSSYHFFFSDLSEILRKSETLKNSYSQMEKRFKSNLEDIITLLCGAAIFKPLDSKEEKKALASNIWILAVSYFAMTDYSAKSLDAAKTIKALKKQLLYLLKPYVTKGEIHREGSIFSLIKVTQKTS